MTSLFAPLSLLRGPALRNRLVLAPLTNLQSNADGTLGEDEFNWLHMRAKSGYGLAMTCSVAVATDGVGFPGQLAAYDERHVTGLARIANVIRNHDGHSVVQLCHSGMRSPEDLIHAQPRCPSANEEFKAREMTLAEVKQSIADFVSAAERCARAGFDGVELHAAHGYLIGQFISSEINQRTDNYGGSLENRSRILFDIIDGIRSTCPRHFSVGVRLSPERFGMKLSEVRQIAQRLFDEEKIDYLDMSLWDVFKEPDEAEFHGRTLVDCFTDLKRGNVRLGAAGKIATGADCKRALEAGLDFVVIGRSAILHHDFPQKVRSNPNFEPTAAPVSSDYLRSEGLGEAFIGYMAGWGFVSDMAPPATQAA